jgi:hypothetical protein
MPSKRGFVTVLEAYFDESERSNGMFAVAGFAFEAAQAKKFTKEWSAVFAPYGFCHMTDLAARKGVFNGTAQTESDLLLKEAVEIINHRISFGVAVSCNRYEVNSLMPRWFGGFDDAYVVCCHIAMLMMGELAFKSKRLDGVAYFFESGHQFQAAAHRLMALLSSHPNVAELYGHRSHRFIGKTDAAPLQAADMFAWEYAKYWDETVGQRKRPMRKSLVALLLDQRRPNLISKRLKVTNITGHALERYAAQAHTLALEEWLAAVRPPSQQVSLGGDALEE